MESLLQRRPVEENLSTDPPISTARGSHLPAQTNEHILPHAARRLDEAGATEPAVHGVPNPNSAWSAPATDTADTLEPPPTARTSQLLALCDRPNDEDPSSAQTQPRGGPQVTSPHSPSADGEDLVMPLESTNCWEHHGPGAWVSICSEPGLRWVCARTGSVDFIDSAKGLLRKWTGRLRYKNISRAKWTQEPNEQTALQYCAGNYDGHTAL